MIKDKHREVENMGYSEWMDRNAKIVLIGFLLAGKLSEDLYWCSYDVTTYPAWH